MRRALLTLQTVEPFDGVALHKNYSTRTGEFVGQDDRDTGVTARGYGQAALFARTGRALVN